MNKDWIRKEKERCCIANWLKHDMIPCNKIHNKIWVPKYKRYKIKY